METEGSTSVSSKSACNSDEKVEQESLSKPLDHPQSPEVTSNTEVTDSFKSLTEKLSMALVNVGAKEDPVKQHLKVSEVTVAGSENEVTAHEWESTKKDLETKICNLENENMTLKSELNVQSEELEIRTIELDLCTQAAETASKQHLESIKKIAKLEAECRRLQALTRKSPSINDNQKAVSVSSFYVDSVTDSQSVDSLKMNYLEPNITEIDQFNNEKRVVKNVISFSEINNIMDDFLEMERMAALSDGQIETSRCNSETEDSSMKTENEVMSQRVYELENALSLTKESLADTESHMVDLQKELTEVIKSKELLESKLVRMETEARIMSTEVDSIKVDVEKERCFSAEMKVKCEGLEKELVEKTEEIRLQKAVNSNVELKVKQDLEVVAADRLSECQKTISSLARQLESLATLEDFLIDTANLPGLSGPYIPKAGGELWKLHSNNTFMPKKILMPTKQAKNNCSLSLNSDDDESPPSSSSSSSSSAVSLNHVGTRSESKNEFEKEFLRNKNGIRGDSC